MPELNRTELLGEGEGAFWDRTPKFQDQRQNFSRKELKDSMRLKSNIWEKKTHRDSELTDEDDQQQAGGVQLNVGVTEGVAEGGVDDH